MGDNVEKLMSKLKKNKKKKEEEKSVPEKSVQSVPEKKPVKEEKEVSEEDLVGAEEEQKEDADTDQKKEEQVKEAQEIIEHEVAVLQNNGVFRRELLGVLRELIDVHKVNTQTLLDIKELIRGAVDGKE